MPWGHIITIAMLLVGIITSYTIFKQQVLDSEAQTNIRLERIEDRYDILEARLHPVELSLERLDERTKK